jgi:pimeloyl-ACP methyl ester carboxylesterase
MSAIVANAGFARLPDGRLITFFLAGPPDGYPVVYCHGAIGSPRWRVPGLDEVIERERIRYVVVNRPGFCGSDPSPGRSVADFGRDVGDLMSALGHRRFSVVGVSAGAPYALACGWALPDLVVSVAAVSPLGPPDGIGASPGLRYRVAPVPFAMPVLGTRLAWLSLRLLRLRSETSARSMIDDYLICRSRWGFELGELCVPVTVWHGHGDRLVPLAHTRGLTAAIPDCMTRVDPDGGHFFYSRRLTEIIRSLLPASHALEPVVPGSLSRAA